jgi:hypothetical protein
MAKVHYVYRIEDIILIYIYMYFINLSEKCVMENDEGKIFCNPWSRWLCAYSAGSGTS